MNLTTSHHERFEQMKSDVNRRQIDWRFYRPDKKEINENLASIIDIIKSQSMPVGPFGEKFVKDGTGHFKQNFYDIPLQHAFVTDITGNFNGIGYVATNENQSILLSSVYCYLRTPEGHRAFCDLELTAICVQTATNHHGQKMAVAMNCISNMIPLSYYEHPANGRLLMAMNGFEYPDQSALVVGGIEQAPNIHVQDAMNKATAFYNQFDLGELEEKDLSSSLLSLFTK